MSKAVIKESSEVLLPLVAPQSLSTAPRPIRVLHVHSGNLYGGVETMLLTQVRSRDLCPALELSFALCFEGRLSAELNAEGAAVHQLGQVRIRQPLSVRRARLALRELLHREAFDVVVTHSCWSQAIFGPVAHAVSVPLVFYLHAPSPGRHWLERWARRTVPDVALCNSQFTAATLSQLYPRARQETIYCPVAPSHIRYSEADTKATRTELQTPSDATVIIQVSRMEAWKGQALHLEALGLLKDLPGWVCWQVGGAQKPGEEKYLEELKALANGLGIGERVRFLEQRSDVGKLLAAADIFCQPNTGPEPFGLAFIEALQAQLPVVTTALGGACEIVDDSCGVLLPPGDAHTLAAALRRLIQERALRIKLGLAGPARAMALCDPAAQMTRFHEALSGVLAQRQENK
jgi:glycosyltransferase involved in cell wall biosynthesis